MHFNLLMVQIIIIIRRSNTTQLIFNIATIKSVRKKWWMDLSGEEWLWRKVGKKCFIAVSSTALCTESPGGI